MKYRLPLLLLFIFIVMNVIFYFIQFEANEIYKTLLSVSTFLFAIFTGFFISRQSARYNEIRNIVSEFDGESSNVYRLSRCYKKEIKDEVEDVIKKEYKRMTSSDDWDITFTEKTSYITNLQNAFDSLKTKKVNPVENAALTRIFVSTSNMQRLRKRALSLGNERIPSMQWFLIIFLVIIILILISTIQFEALLFATFLKALFSTIIILVIIMLWQFDNLHFFERTVGSSSAEDVLDIIKGKK